MNFTKYILTLLLLIGIAQTALPCSSFVLKNGKTILLGKNFDWTFDQGYLIKNVKNTAKFAYFSHNGQPARWTSKYGSITFNQNGKEMPYGGMNEKGLMVEMLWLDDIRFNISEDKAYLNELEWIQYQLDNFQTIDEVIINIEKLKIYPIKGKIHYILADTNGKSVIIEYLDGKPKIYEKDFNTCQAITNKTVVHSEKFIDNLKGIPKRNTSETYRYHQLENQIKKLQSPNDFSENTAFQMLKNVSIPKGNFKTVWSIVYNIDNKSIFFFSHANKKIKQINLNNTDFEQTLSYYDINQDAETILDNKLKPISEQINFEAMSASLTHLGFDIDLCKELSEHQIKSRRANKFDKGVFFQPYFNDITKQGSPFLLDNSIPRFKGNVYVLIGPKTFSAGQYLATTISDNNLATIIGTPSGNKPTCQTGASLLKLPNTKKIITMSYTFGERPDTTKNNEDSLHPDIEIYQTLEDVINGKDIQFQYILKELIN